jgi:hypothetical protein
LKYDFIYGNNYMPNSGEKEILDMVGIPSSSIAVVSFQKIVEDCIAGILSKERALKLLESKYKSSVIDIKEAFGEDFHSFCCYIRCDFDKYIKICDGAERNKPLYERLAYNNVIQKVIEKVETAYKENGLESEDAVRDVYQEVHQIQNWCRENRELEKWYEKCKADIEALPEMAAQNVQEFEQHYFIQTLQKNAPQAYEVVKRLIDAKIVEYTNDYFNFKCAKGCVGLFFANSGYTDYKTISRFILINGDKCKLSTLYNCKKNTEPKEWKELEKYLQDNLTTK